MSSQMTRNWIWTKGLATLQMIHSVTLYTDFITASFTFKKCHMVALQLHLCPRDKCGLPFADLHETHKRATALCADLSYRPNCTQIGKQVRKVRT